MKALLIALAVLFVLPSPVFRTIPGGANEPTEVYTADAGIGIIGGADGPTAVFTTDRNKPDANGAIIGGADEPTEIPVTAENEPDASVAIIGGANEPTGIFVGGAPCPLSALCGFLCVLFANAGR